MRRKPQSIRASNGLDPLEPRLLYCATTAITADLATDLISQWSFEESGATTISDVSNQAANHTGTLASGASSSSNALCGSGSARFIGGSAELSIPNHSEINLITQGQRSVSFWFNADNIDIDTRRQVLYEEGATSRGLSIYLYNGQLIAGGWNQVVSESDWDGTWFSTDNISSGGWHHVVLTLDGDAKLQPGALNVYLDGALFGSGEGSQLWGHAGDITFGNGSDTRFADGSAAVGSQGFAGWIDDARLYNRALSAHDVAVLSGRFNEGAAITLARSAKFDLIAEAQKNVKVAEAQVETKNEQPAQRVRADALERVRPIKFPTADEDKAEVRDDSDVAESDTQQPAPDAPVNQSQSDAHDELDHELVPNAPRTADVQEGVPATPTSEPTDPAQGQATAHVDEPKQPKRSSRKDRESQTDAPVATVETEQQLGRQVKSLSKWAG